ncbi:MAG: threonylcarbamoyl-AMP synthase [Alphaproteobacteria bacterium]|nr:threonylcarbamoyl-AMP synthase [Alphaproteobacteria bacterium]
MSTTLLHDAVHIIQQGGLVAFPTETVYGLGANALNERAVAEIYAMKSRPRFNPLIVHFAAPGAARAQVRWNAPAEALADAFWPGPLTLVLPRAQDSRVALLASAGLPTLAVRVPAHPLARALLEAAGLPLAAPSANRSGRISPTAAAHVRAEFGDGVPVLDGGPCEVGLESTVVDLSGDAPLLLRSGAVTAEALSRVLGREVARAGKDAGIAAPGMLQSHYAPTLPLRLNADSVRPGEALLAFGPQPLTGAAYMLNLSEAGDVKEAAANLFAYLRRLDQKDFTGIAAMPVPQEGLGAAINDRLMRASRRDK